MHYVFGDKRTNLNNFNVFFGLSLKMSITYCEIISVLFIHILLGHYWVSLCKFKRTVDFVLDIVVQQLQSA